MRAVLLILMLAGAIAPFSGCRDAAPERAREDARAAAEAAAERAREIGEQAGRHTAEAAAEARRALDEGTITAKIKAKMALDDTLTSRGIRVETQGGTVTVSGTVGSAAERERALQLARETEGVTQVVDKLRILR